MNMRNLFLFSLMLASSTTANATLFNFCRTTWRSSRNLIARFTRPGHLPVYMSHGESIRLSPDQDDKQEPATISTNGLCGCIVVVLYAENNDGLQRAIMTHYPPGSEDEHEDTLADLIDNIKILDTAYDPSNVKFFIFSPPFEGAFSIDSDEERKHYEHIHKRLYRTAQKSLEIEELYFEFIPYKTLNYPRHHCGEVKATLSQNGLHFHVCSTVQSENYEYTRESF